MFALGKCRHSYPGAAGACGADFQLAMCGSCNAIEGTRKTLAMVYLEFGLVWMG